MIAHQSTLAASNHNKTTGAARNGVWMKTISVSLGLVIGFVLIAIAQPPRGGRPIFPAQVIPDHNSDGIISADEIAQAATALRKLDKNEDRQLTEDELRPVGGLQRGRPGTDHDRPSNK